MSNVITNRDQLICALQEASELEQVLMCQYLFAALSIKKAGEAGITAAQAEIARRWEAQILMVARQEMEHLALVNNLLLGIGAQPYFSRPNFPVRYDYYPIPVPFILERFDEASIGRFVLFESPHTWSQGDPGFDAWARLGATAAANPLLQSIPLRELRCRPYALKFESVLELYEELRAAINNVHHYPDLDNLFIGDPNRQPFEDFQFNFEFNIFTFQVTDIRTANAAMDLIMKQGEGIHAEPDFSSHFRIFSDIYEEMAASGFDAALPVVTNPSIYNVTDKYAQRAMTFFNYSYTTMLYMLVSFYTYFSPESADKSHDKISTALQETAFAPMMTMVIRPLGEIVTRLPAGSGGGNAGPNWDIPDADRDLDPSDEPAFFIERLADMTSAARQLADSAPSKEVAARLNYMFENLTRVLRNFHRITNT
ncbi:MAG TPA: ferritin-like protein [Blastocatellia bacterium]|nr:ferritin-like protein [Blastocatellia bacterium]